MITQFSKSGLRVRPSYEQLMNAIVDNDILNLKKVPNVFDANWLMSTPQMTQIRKDALLDVQNLQLEKDKQDLLNIKANEIARKKGIHTAVAREGLKSKPTVEHYDISDGDKVQKTMDDAYYDMELDEEDRKRKEAEKISMAVKKVKQANEATAPNTIAHQMASGSSSSHQAPEEKLVGPGRPKIGNFTPKGVKKAGITKKTSKKGSKNVLENQVVFPQPTPMVVNDEETQQKRKVGDSPKTKPTKKTKIELKNMKVKPLEADLKVERSNKKTKQLTIKQQREMKREGESGASSSGQIQTAVQEPKRRGRPPKQDNDGDDDVQVQQIKTNNNKSTRYWKQQSANEIRNQLKLRDRKRFNDEWAFKTKAQLIDIIKQLVKDGEW